MRWGRRRIRNSEGCSEYWETCSRICHVLQPHNVIPPGSWREACTSVSRTGSLCGEAERGGFASHCKAEVSLLHCMPLEGDCHLFGEVMHFPSPPALQAVCIHLKDMI